ncbi:hypothetical protein [Cellulomonas sp. Leaf395]|uniref:hypothetical protein n=1 Tax=Cellulomonas sp. Leaf395 TaxID=1736362 RepID=UPI0007020ABC|nr:hypothetical protein [Cellulomonas sp. Leaf395]KQS97209.1 fimbrial assembly protein [Cellulomonas sp. Leaf395]
MTTLLERPKGRPSAGTALSGTLPQVNLLPPEVRAARGLRATKRWLVVGIVVTVVGCVGAFGLALISGTQAATELAEAQAETTRLQQEQAKYAEVPVVLDALAAATSARTIGMSTDVQWKSYVDAIAAVLPANVSFDSTTVTVATPMSAAPAPADPLQLPSVGQIQFTARSSAIPDTSAWIDALNSVPGLGDAWVSSATVGEDETGIYYTVASTVQVTDAAYSHRFDATEGEG